MYGFARFSISCRSSSSINFIKFESSSMHCTHTHTPAAHIFLAFNFVGLRESVYFLFRWRINKHEKMEREKETEVRKFSWKFEQMRENQWKTSVLANVIHLFIQCCLNIQFNYEKNSYMLQHFHLNSYHVQM